MIPTAGMTDGSSRGKFAAVLAVMALPLFCQIATADEPGPPAAPLTTLVCRDRERPEVSATIVLNLVRKRLIDSSGTGGTILFGDSSLPLKVTPAMVEWEAGGNTFWLNRATLELDVNGRVFLCQIAKNQI
ncbi:MAG TPA: hypothetical protein VME45_10120 [Stellaceae bacterium]|nr:hypothetical protein [Stellaceae bacterium]